MSMMIGSHKRGNVAEVFPYPPPMRQDNDRPHTLNYCIFLFGKVDQQKCAKCPYESCTYQMKGGER